MASVERRVRTAAVLAAAVALLACESSGGDATDSGVLAPDGSMTHDAASGDGDGDGDSRGDGDGAGDGDGDGDGDELDGSAGDPLDATADTDGATSDAAPEIDASDDAMLPALEDLPYVREVIAFTAGASAGFGQAMFPDIVYGPPEGRGTGSGSLDVLSLGVGGEITLGFGALDIVDGEGADFIVFENAFIGNGTPFIELGEVSVSADGETWHTFACDELGSGGEHPGCAGWSPTLRYDPQLVFPLDPELTGGNAFDLGDLGVERARYVRIRDLETQPGSANTGGFDLDAAGLVHYEARD